MMTWEETCMDLPHTLKYYLDRNVDKPQKDARITRMR